MNDVDPHEGNKTGDALYGHCVTVYQAMMDRAIYPSDFAKVEPPIHYAGDKPVYRGALTHLMTRELGLSTPLYTHVTRNLKAMECIHQLRRGGGGTPSEWELHEAPNLAAYLKLQESGKLPAWSRQSASRTETLEDQVANLTRRVNDLENYLFSAEGGDD